MISEIRPILLIRPILGNVLFFVTGPWNVFRAATQNTRQIARAANNFLFFSVSAV